MLIHIGSSSRNPETTLHVIVAKRTQSTFKMNSTQPNNECVEYDVNSTLNFFLCRCVQWINKFRTCVWDLRVSKRSNNRAHTERNRDTALRMLKYPMTTTATRQRWRHIYICFFFFFRLFKKNGISHFSLRLKWLRRRRKTPTLRTFIIHEYLHVYRQMNTKYIHAVTHGNENGKQVYGRATFN